MKNNKKENSDKELPKGREEERRGNALPTHPDIMGPYPASEQVQGTVLGKEEQHPSGKDAVRDKRDQD